MSCHRIRDELSAYLDDTLSQRRRRPVEQHLKSCADCRRELDALRSVVDAARSLPLEIRPPRDLWPEIAGRLPTRRSPRSGPLPLAPAPSKPWRLQLAAAVLALLVLSVPLSVWWAGRREQPAPALPATTAALPGAATARQAELARSEDRVLLTRSDLTAAIERRRDVVDDDLVRVLESSTRLLDQAIGEIRSALERDPENRRLLLQLAARYRQESRLLQTISRV